jgi:hypothetical protein
MTTAVQAVAAVMADVSSVAKRDLNAQQGFNFRGIDAFVNAVGPALRKHGVVVVPTVKACEYGTVEVGQKRTQMAHVRVTVRYRWHGPEGDYIDSVSVGEAMDSGDKATAKAMSVAFRTVMLQALALPTDDPDPDSQTYERSAALTDEEVAAQDAGNARGELGRWMAAEGLDPQEAVARWAADHDGSHIKDTTDGPGIRAMRAAWVDEIAQQRSAEA